MDKTKISKCKYLYRIVKGRDDIYHIEKHKIIYMNRSYIYIKEANDKLTQILNIPMEVVDLINDDNIYNEMCNAKKSGYSKFTFEIDLQSDNINDYDKQQKEILIAKLSKDLKEMERLSRYYSARQQELKSQLGELLSIKQPKE